MLKKNRKRILGGIESKIVILILAAIVLVAGVFILVTMRQSKMLSELTMETSRKQQISMSETTDTVNATVIQQDLDRITELVARETDEMFRDVAIRVQMVGDYARKLLENPENVPRVEWYRPDPDKDGELFVKGLLAEGVEVEDVDDQMRVIANLSDLMVSVCKAYGTNNIWFSLPDGMGTLMADTVPSEWVEKDGSYRSYDAWDRYWFWHTVESGWRRKQAGWSFPISSTTSAPEKCASPARCRYTTTTGNCWVWPAPIFTWPRCSAPWRDQRRTAVS